MAKHPHASAKSPSLTTFATRQRRFRGRARESSGNFVESWKAGDLDTFSRCSIDAMEIHTWRSLTIFPCRRGEVPPHKAGYVELSKLDLLLGGTRHPRYRVKAHRLGSDTRDELKFLRSVSLKHLRRWLKRLHQPVALYAGEETKDALWVVFPEHAERSLGLLDLCDLHLQVESFFGEPVRFELMPHSFTAAVVAKGMGLGF